MSLRPYAVTEVITTIRVHVVLACDVNDAVTVVEAARGDVFAFRGRERAQAQVLVTGADTKEVTKTRWAAVAMPETEGA